MFTFKKSDGLPHMKGKANKLDAKRRRERRHELVSLLSSENSSSEIFHVLSGSDSDRQN